MASMMTIFKKNKIANFRVKDDPDLSIKAWCVPWLIKASQTRHFPKANLFISFQWEVPLLQFLHYADQKSHTPEFRNLSTESRFCKLLYIFLCNMSNCVECTYSPGQRFHNCHF
jgi:hypothetical protein